MAGVRHALKQFEFYVYTFLNMHTFFCIILGFDQYSIAFNGLHRKILNQITFVTILQEHLQLQNRKY